MNLPRVLSSRGMRRPVSPHMKVLLGLLLGAIAGGIAQASLGHDNEMLKSFISNFAQPVGQIFLSLIFMVVVPLLFSALVLGVADIGDAARIGRIGVRSLVLTLMLSSIAVCIGIAGVNAVQPGNGIAQADRDRLVASMTSSSDAAKKVEQSKQAKTAAETIVEMVPKNPLESAVKALEGGILPFMVFAVIFGIAMAGIPYDQSLPLRQFFEGLFAVSQKMIAMAMRFAPIGVFGLVFSTAASLGASAFVALGKYAILVLAALAIQQFGVYSLALKLFAKRDPVEFFRRMRTVMITAFATSSSNATLPTALQAATDELDLPKDVSSFVLTIGATANQNGTALFEGITIVFLAQFFGVSLDLGQQIMVMGLAILAGVGTAGVPGGAWPMIAIILVKIGVPAQAIGICLGIDRILDMSRTVLNVTGDMTIAACVAAMEPKGLEPALAD